MQSVYIQTGQVKHQAYATPLVDDETVMIHRLPKPIPEYVLFSANNLAKNAIANFSLVSLDYAIRLETAWIDAPAQDAFIVRLIQNNQILTELTIAKNRSPSVFPVNVLTPDITIQIVATENITFLRMYASLCRIIKGIAPS
jgi:hypothetical protein